MMIAEQMKKTAISFLEKEADNHSLTEDNLYFLKRFMFSFLSGVFWYDYSVREEI